MSGESVCILKPLPTGPTLFGVALEGGAILYLGSPGPMSRNHPSPLLIHRNGLVRHVDSVSVTFLKHFFLELGVCRVQRRVVLSHKMEKLVAARGVSRYVALVALPRNCCYVASSLCRSSSVANDKVCIIIKSLESVAGVVRCHHHRILRRGFVGECRWKKSGSGKKVEWTGQR